VVLDKPAGWSLLPDPAVASAGRAGRLTGRRDAGRRRGDDHRSTVGERNVVPRALESVRGACGHAVGQRPQLSVRSNGGDPVLDCLPVNKVRIVD
jgi:hypothetical protein